MSASGSRLARPRERMREDAAVRAALAVAWPGVVARAVDTAAREGIAESGFGHRFPHRTGHGPGTEVHEPPYVPATSESVPGEGMVRSIEPGTRLPGRFGVLLERIVYLRPDGPEILSEPPRRAMRVHV